VLGSYSGSRGAWTCVCEGRGSNYPHNRFLDSLYNARVMGSQVEKRVDERALGFMLFRKFERPEGAQRWDAC